MAQTQQEILTGRTFATLLKGGKEITFNLPSWFPTSHEASELERMVAKFTPEAVMGLVIAQLLVNMRAAVRMSQRTERETKAGIETLTPKTPDEVAAMLEAFTIAGPGATQAKKLAQAKKLLSGLTPDKLKELLAAMNADAPDAAESEDDDATDE